MNIPNVSIAVASQLTGLTPRQIRYLEQIAAIYPEYIEVGSTRHRRYGTALLDKLSRIKTLLDKGYTTTAAVSIAEGLKEEEDG